MYTEQFNLRIDSKLKADIQYLDGHGVQVSELVRPELKDLIEKAKERLLAEKEVS